MSVFQILQWVLVKAKSADLTVEASSVMQTVITNTSAYVSRGVVDSGIKVATARMVMALTS